MKPQNPSDFPHRENSNDPARASARAYGLPGHLPRLRKKVYRGEQLVHWTLTLRDRPTGWLDARFHHRFREFTLHAAARFPLYCAIYCLMPDHMHLIWGGLGEECDQLQAMRHFRRWLNLALKPHRLQPQAHDHVLREWEKDDAAFEEALDYIWKNPVRAGLVEKAEDWLYCGTIVPGYPLLHPRMRGWRADLDKIVTLLRRAAREREGS